MNGRSSARDKKVRVVGLQQEGRLDVSHGPDRVAKPLPRQGPRAERVEELRLRAQGCLGGCCCDTPPTKTDDW